MSNSFNEAPALRRGKGGRRVWTTALPTAFNEAPALRRGKGGYL